MENIENVKKLVSALKSINQDIERKPKCFMTPLQVKSTEETLYKISGIKVNINSIGDFKELEEYYQKKYLSNNNDGDYLEEEWIKAEKEIDEYPNGTKYKAIGGGYWIKLGVGRYKWCTGAVFPRVGGDWSGYIMLPKEIISNRKIEFEAQFNIGDKVRIKIKLGKPRTGRILAIFYSETADPWAEYPKGFDEVVKKVMYRIMLDDESDPKARELEARHYLSRELELIQ